MPLLVTLEKFIACVEHNKHIEAIETFYSENASMQENNDPPRFGRDVLVEHEKQAQLRYKPIESICVRPVFHLDDLVVIRWIFKLEAPNGSVVRFEEISYQRWEGEHITQEKFFYDPKQFVTKPSLDTDS